MSKLFFEMMSVLAFEAQQIMWLRGIELAKAGGAAKREARRMVNEETTACQQAILKAATGTAPIGIDRGYRSKVQVNARRLSRSVMR